MKRWKKRVTIAGSIVCLLATAVIVYNACTVVTVKQMFSRAKGIPDDQITSVQILKFGAQGACNLTSSQKIEDLLSQLGPQKFRLQPYWDVLSPVIRYTKIYAYFFPLPWSQYVVSFFTSTGRVKDIVIGNMGTFDFVGGVYGAKGTQYFCQPLDCAKVEQILDTFFDARFD